jgi:LacI family transcriptional regulator
VDGTSAEEYGKLTPARATTADVAALAGVSLKTVSRVFGGNANVSGSTKEKVQRAAKELSFRPNLIARELRTGGIPTTVGFVMGDLSNPFYSKVAAGVERVLSTRGLTMLIAATDDESRQEPTVVQSMLDRGVLALLLVPIAADHSYLEASNPTGVPVVAVDRPLSNALSDAVVFSNREGAAQAVQLLVDSGHRRIAFVGSSSSLYTHGERVTGYRQALEKNGITAEATLERTDAPTIEAAAKATTELLEMAVPPTAIFAGNNRAAIGVFKAIHARGSDTAMISFDDFELADALGITVVSHDPIQMGMTAAELALARVARSGQNELTTTEIPTALVRRKSHLVRHSSL